MTGVYDGNLHGAFGYTNTVFNLFLSVFCSLGTTHTQRFSQFQRIFHVYLNNKILVAKRNKIQQKK